MFKKLLLISLSLYLTGCVSYGGNPSTYTKNGDGEDRVNYNYLLFKGWGVGTSGTSTVLTSHYSITTQGVADQTNQVKQVTSDVCGLTLIKKDNTNKTLPILADVHDGDKIKSYGFDYYSGKLKTSNGNAVKLIEAKAYENPFENCIVYEATTGNDTGMSGGPVFNEKNELVGILVYSVHQEYYSEIDQDEKFESMEFGKLVIKHKNGDYVPFMPEYDVTRKVTKVNYSIFVPLISIKFWLNNAMKYTEDFGEYYDRDTKHNKVMDVRKYFN